MDELEINIDETKTTPNVEYVDNENKLVVEGKLIPEDPFIFFSKLEDWLDKFINSKQPDLTVEFYLYYYNTSSLKIMVSFIEKLDRINKNAKNIRIIWKCDAGDEDNIEDGNDFKKALNLGFDISIVEDEE
jgi:hypothetical protein